MQKSYWQKQRPLWECPQLNEDQETDIAIVGGGLTGLLCAWMLKDSGRRVTVIEKRRFLENNSARNTGKVSALHGALYHTLPADIAQSVYQLNRTAVDHYEQLIRTADIACRWQRTSAILAAQSEEGAAILNQEKAVLTALGAQLSDPPSFPLPLIWADQLAAADQALLDPWLFQAGLLEVLKDKVTLYEESPVVEIQDHCLISDGSYRLRFKDLILTTQFPAFDRLQLYAARLHYQREAAAAFRCDPALDGLMRNTVDPGQALSLRFARKEDQPTLILAGPAIGIHHYPKDPYAPLLQTAKTLGVHQPLACWSAQDLIPRRRLPFIGQIQDHYWIASGYSKWGYTWAMIAAEMISAQVQDPAFVIPAYLRARRKGDLFSLYTLGNAATLTEAFFKDRFTVTPENQPRRTGTVVRLHGRRYGVVIPEEGLEFLVDLTCPHMGCPLHYNPADQTWDCPCHGSRFTLDGRSLYSPSNVSLQHYPGVNSLHPNLK